MSTTHVWMCQCVKLNDKQYHQKLKRDCNEDKVGDLILLWSKTIYPAFS